MFGYAGEAESSRARSTNSAQSASSTVELLPPEEHGRGFRQPPLCHRSHRRRYVADRFLEEVGRVVLGDGGDGGGSGGVIEGDIEIGIGAVVGVGMTVIVKLL